MPPKAATSQASISSHVIRAIFAPTPLRRGTRISNVFEAIQGFVQRAKTPAQNPGNVSGTAGLKENDMLSMDGIPAAAPEKPGSCICDLIS
jgi:hypothetical protein